MKTLPALLPIAALWFATALPGDPAFGQAPRSRQINPATGYPVSQRGGLTNWPRIDPATGMPAGRPGELTPQAAVRAESEVAEEVRKLTSNHQYEEALGRCLAFHDKWKTSASMPLLYWAELGKQYPKAKAALIEIRDGDLREFSEGRGYYDLFQEVSSINRSLHQEDVTYDLFKSFRENDPELAHQCYWAVENLLVARGEYQWCYDHMGEPQAKFDSICQRRRMEHDAQDRYQVIHEDTQRRIAEMRQQRGLTNKPTTSLPDTSATMKKGVENSFVGQTRQLIEILVATGHKTDAEKIRDQAVAVLDDARLKSAVADAEGNVRKRSAPASNK